MTASVLIIPGGLVRKGRAGQKNDNELANLNKPSLLPALV